MNKPISKCCKKPLVTVHGDEGTSFWKCEGCGQPSDPYQDNQNSNGTYPKDVEHGTYFDNQNSDLRDKIFRLACDTSDGTVSATDCAYEFREILSKETERQVREAYEDVDEQLQAIHHSALPLISSYKSNNGVDKVAEVGALRIGIDEMRVFVKDRLKLQTPNRKETEDA